jgi:hypothetical protein
MSGPSHLVGAALALSMVVLTACAGEEPSADPTDTRLPVRETVVTTPGEARHADCVDSQTTGGVDRAYSGVYCSCALDEVDRLHVDSVEDLPASVLAGCLEVSLDAGSWGDPDPPPVGSDDPSPPVVPPYVPAPPTAIGGEGTVPDDS